MLKFSDYEYKRPDLEQIKAEFNQQLEAFRDAQALKEQEQIILKINQLRDDVSTQGNLAFIRASINTKDEFYENERNFFDEAGPEFEELSTLFYQELVKSPYRRELEEKWGTQFFDLADFSIKSFKPEIIPLLQEENRLSSEYSRLVASAEIQFEGEVLTLAQIDPYTESTDRQIREKAVKAKFDFFAENEKKFDELYDKLVKTRHQIAQKLGYKNFVDVGYLRMLRVDYNAEKVAKFRDQVRTYIVPLATKLRERQKERIGVQDLMFWDESLAFLTGNANPEGGPEWIIEKGKQMYQELSPETNEFFTFMNERELMDLEAKKGKEAGGYCTFIENYEAPFIFSNFNGTSGDIDVLTHEAGHAFQVYMSRHTDIPEYVWPTHEAAEIHSMSMEFLTWPWMENFFGEQTEKYKFAHLSSGILFLPYGVAVDEFQHRIYEKPDMTPAERKAVWKELEEIYLPHRNYGDHNYLNSGGVWQRQGHIYEAPFYYIDYTLAQICAFQFWKKSREDFDAAWKDYVHLCKLGGSKSFTELVKEANLKSPFEEGSLESVVKEIENWLDGVDDKKL
ncbi:M3 family oligoendopeptidase [Jeotgalibacillus haloalkalitolerans]|uniref:M3 family oligoendopeptidase n=1 Tax=Jeotgalibacillus haloalkalitolerans TaxID=3104292 RepID=A0ABU5KNV4_9BACL|nr:M3 family oligoendopeptidase [Jeotgalibacillus sp. HH7-29]MDZ5712940.1 M3 family oligoendopeptidase [Jeotgalibacillus sp. HH7-29]